MAKKKTKPAESDDRIIKFRVTADEQDVIRLAAALRRTSMAEFAKVIVVEEARRLTKNIKLPDQ